MIAKRSSSIPDKVVGRINLLGTKTIDDGENNIKPMRKNTWTVLLFLLVCFLLGKPAFAKHPKIASDLEAADPDSNVDVIVQFTQAPNARLHAKVLDRGGQLKTELGVVKGAAYRIRASELQELANDPDVAHLSADHPLRGTATAASAATLDYYDATVNAPFAWQMGLNGSGVAVAVIDSGIIDVPDLHGSKYRVIYNQEYYRHRHRQ